ncbi:MAG: hypothetical protein MUF42_14255 [Cytophagaceae bacterium]|jgi:hypothetical protein|nr:hypothetical protein [Cytophagaceae bacterium]
MDRKTKIISHTLLIGLGVAALLFISMETFPVLKKDKLGAFGLTMLTLTISYLWLRVKEFKEECAIEELKFIHPKKYTEPFTIGNLKNQKPK